MARRITVKSLPPAGAPAPMAGGGVEGADRTSRETVKWTPAMGAPDNIINPVKPLADARGRDMATNDGYALGAVALHRDSIVGAEYRLNAAPNYRVLGADEAWAEEFQLVVESRFHTLAESPACWLDASRRLTLTEIVRMAVGSFVMAGEFCAAAEWITDSSRPVRTAIQLISPDRIDNPRGVADSATMRRGVELDRRGRPIAYHVRVAHPNDLHQMEGRYRWKRVNAETSWGRLQFLHVMEQRFPEQRRGISDMTSVLKHMRMTKQFQEIVLQNAVVNATYAAAIESEMPTEQLVAAMGGGSEGADNALDWYLGNLAQYLDSSRNIQLDGVKIPHLFPGTKLNLQPAGSPGGVGADFETSLLRHIAAGLGLSYEEFARDYTKTNYSSARASMATTWRYMQGRKKIVADKVAETLYRLVVEEEIANGNLPLPAGKTRSWFYEPLVKDALCRATWIGAARGQIDEKKETEAAILRIDSGLTTLESECARLGYDFRDVIAQRAREKRLLVAAGLWIDPAVSADRASPGRPSSDQGAADEPDDYDGEEQESEE
jgi:lambda family phage portal protein